MRAAARRAWDRAARLVADAIGLLLPWIIRRGLRRGLRGVWRWGDARDLPDGPFVLAPNHHSWWDVYLAWLVTERIDRDAVALMDPAQLARFPFFRRIGVLATAEVRPALRELKEGKVLVVFPEGELRRPGAMGPLEPGAAFFARKAAVPIVPAGFRVVLRGAEKPEAYVSFGAPLEPSDDATAELRERLDAMLADLDRALERAEPEAIPEGARPWLGGRAGTLEGAWWERLWRR